MTRGAWLLAMLGLAGCDGSFTGPTGGGAPPPMSVGVGGGAGGVDVTQPPVGSLPPTSVPDLPSAAVCQSAPSGRGYVGLAGERLEADRGAGAALTDGHRPFRNYSDNGTWMMVRDTRRALGVGGISEPENNSPGVGASFGTPATGWYEESNVGAFAVFTTFNFAFKSCERAITSPPAALKAGWYELALLEPTAERAAQFCRRTQHSAWLRAPTDGEVQTCVDLALSLVEEPDVKRRWAYVCASVIASSNFLAN